MQNKELESKIQYLGYEGINLDRFSVNTLKNLQILVRDLVKESNSKDSIFGSAYVEFEKLDGISLDEVKDIASQFLDKYFNLHEIYSADIETMKNSTEYFSKNKTTEDAYKKINSLLVLKNPLDLKIDLVKGHTLVGAVNKPLIIMPNDLTNSNKKVYFSNIELGDQLNLLSAGTLVHEIAHTQQEHNIGYAKDYLNKEIISIFLEKVVALELDSTGELLKASEKVRLTDLLNRYYRQLSLDGASKMQAVDDLLYIKSTLYAEKLFDMYLNERKQSKRDKYFYDIQDVFDGKITVEDLIDKRNITTPQCVDLGLLKRHM